jgi:hypothetical protein
MHVFKAALILMAISVDTLHVTAYNCGKDAPQNVCEVSHGDLAIYGEYFCFVLFCFRNHPPTRRTA